MKTKELIKYFFSCGAIIYTVGSVLIFAISLSVSDASAATILAPKPFLFFLGLAYVLSLGNTLYRSSVLSKPIRRLLHLLCYLLGFFAFVLLCGVKFAFAVIFTTVFGIIYAIVAVASSVIKKQISKSGKTPPAHNVGITDTVTKNKTKKKKSDVDTYQSRFS